MAKSLSWSQVNAWRISQHCLSRRLEKADFLEAVRRTGGIQAQVMSAAEWALGTRVDGLTTHDVQSALWQERSLIKTWAMRATLHLIAFEDLPLYIAARSVDDPRNWVGYFEYYGISKTQYEAYLTAAPEILGSQPMNREQFAAALAKHTGLPALGELMTSKSWGTPLKPLAWRGHLCFGPSSGQNVTFVNPRKWIGEQEPVEPWAALQEIARRYLRAYGPATVEEFTLWWGAHLTAARKLFRSLEAELEVVELEGRKVWALSDTLEEIQNANTTGVVNLLPLFDAYTMGIGRGAAIEPILPRQYQSLVYRPQGWISSVILADGYFQGIWELAKQRSKTVLLARMFSDPTSVVQKGMEAEIERLSAFLNTPLILEYREL